jgi:hypothetical protein
MNPLGLWLGGFFFGLIHTGSTRPRASGSIDRSATPFLGCGRVAIERQAQIFVADEILQGGRVVDVLHDQRGVALAEAVPGGDSLLGLVDDPGPVTVALDLPAPGSAAWDLE